MCVFKLALSVDRNLDIVRLKIFLPFDMNLIFSIPCKDDMAFPLYLRLIKTYFF